MRGVCQVVEGPRTLRLMSVDPDMLVLKARNESRKAIWATAGIAVARWWRRHVQPIDLLAMKGEGVAPAACKARADEQGHLAPLDGIDLDSPLPEGARRIRRLPLHCPRARHDLVALHKGVDFPLAQRHLRQSASFKVTRRYPECMVSAADPRP